MPQVEQVIKIMETNGGYATLGFLYQNVDVSKWKTQTPYASIRRIVKDERYFFKIKPRLWALNEYKEEVLKNLKFKVVLTKMKNLIIHTIKDYLSKLET